MAFGNFAIQLAALRTLDTFGGDEPGKLILEQWSTLAPETRRGALDLLVSRAERARRLLDDCVGL